MADDNEVIIKDPSGGLSYDEYRRQATITVDDGEFFDRLDDAFGIVPRTDKVVEEDPEAES